MCAFSRKSINFALKPENDMRILLTIMLFACGLSSWAQDGWQQYMDKTGNLEDVETAGWEAAYETLSELAEHPFDINTATRDDLSQLPFLTAQEVEDIIAFVNFYGPLKSAGELAMIRNLSYEKRQLLLCFIYIGKEQEQGFPKLENILKYGTHTLTATAKIPFYEREGDKNGYLGYPYRHNLRYTFSYGNAVKAGIVGAQDAGEPFFANRNKAGYDFYSFYAMIKNMGRLKTLVLGRYRANFAHGLVMNTDFSLGKIGMLANLGRNQNQLRPHSSTMQANYLQGAAATVEVAKGLDATAFVSWRYIDATLNDSGRIQTIRTDGYHRTVNEMDHKDNASQLCGGTHLGFFSKGFHAGLTATYSRLNEDLRPATSAIYRYYYASGNNFWNASVDYGYTGAKFTVSGETATGGCGALATLNTLSWKPLQELSLMAVQRFYSKSYYSLFSEGFSDGGRVQNESGIYIGANWQPMRRLQFSAYTDYAYFPWPRYQVSQASHSWDHLVQMTWMPEKWKIGMRYRLKRRETDSSDKSSLVWKNEHRGRLSIGYDDGTWSSQTQGDMAYSKTVERSFGWMVSEQLQLRAQWAKSKWTATAGIAYFHTDDLDSRLYTYERGMLYGFNFPMFYGEGIRHWLMAKAEFSSRLMVTAKIGTTNYFDRTVIGTGYQQVNHSAMTDLELQLRWKI